MANGQQHSNPLFIQHQRRPGSSQDRLPAALQHQGPSQQPANSFNHAPLPPPTPAPAPVPAPTPVPAQPRRVSASAAALLARSPFPAPVNQQPQRAAVVALRPKIDAVVRQIFALSEDLRFANEDLTAFRLDFDPEVDQGFYTRFRGAKEAEREERQRTIDAAYERIGSALQEVLQGYVASVQDARVEELRQTVATLKAMVENAAPASAPLSAQPVAGPSSVPLAAPTPVRPDQSQSLLARLAAVEEWQRRHGDPELERVKERVQKLETTAQQSTDPRGRPGARATAPGSPAPDATPAHQPCAQQRDLDALKRDVAGLAERVDGAASSALGKRLGGDATAEGAPAAKVPRTDDAVEQLGKRVDEVEKRLEGVSNQVEQAARDKEDEMDIEKDDPGEGLEKLERRLGEMRGELENELKPMKESFTALQEQTSTLSSTIDTVAKDVTALKPSLPPADAPDHPAKLLSALTKLGARIEPLLSTPQLTAPERSVLVVMCAAAAEAGQAGPDDAPAVAQQFAERVRAWNTAGAGFAALAARVDRLAQKLDKEAASTNAKFCALAELSLFLEESIFPELKEISELIEYWREQKILPDAAWSILDEQDDDGDAGGDGGHGAPPAGGTAGVNGALPARSAAAGGAFGTGCGGAAAGMQAGAVPQQQQPPQRAAHPLGGGAPAQSSAQPRGAQGNGMVG